LIRSKIRNFAIFIMVNTKGRAPSALSRDRWGNIKRDLTEPMEFVPMEMSGDYGDDIVRFAELLEFDPVLRWPSRMEGIIIEVFDRRVVLKDDRGQFCWFSLEQ